jgi:uncharacterized protein GlcG (DUF336 family)
MGDQPDLVDAGHGPTASQAAGMTLQAARRGIRAAGELARRLGVPLSIAVVDSGDELVAFERMDGADLVSVRLARDKAYTALVNRMATADLGPMVQPGTEFYGYDSVAGGRMIVFAGGVPIERGGVLVGAVGVSGGDSSQDQAAAQAAAAAIVDGDPG